MQRAFRATFTIFFLIFPGAVHQNSLFLFFPFPEFHSPPPLPHRVFPAVASFNLRTVTVALLEYTRLFATPSVKRFATTRNSSEKEFHGIRSVRIKFTSMKFTSLKGEEKRGRDERIQVPVFVQ